MYIFGNVHNLIVQKNTLKCIISLDKSIIHIYLSPSWDLEALVGKLHVEKLLRKI